MVMNKISCSFSLNTKMNSSGWCFLCSNKSNNICSTWMRVNHIDGTQTRVNDIVMCTFLIMLWEMTKKWLRNDQEMTEKWPRNDWEMTKKRLRYDHKMTKSEWEISYMTIRNDIASFHLPFMNKLQQSTTILSIFISFLVSFHPVLSHSFAIG